MWNTIRHIMNERNIDLTSVIRLALYLLDAYMARSSTRSKDLHAIVREIEAQAAPGKPSFATYTKPTRYEE